jgi:hypothetical protein
VEKYTKNEFENVNGYMELKHFVGEIKEDLIYRKTATVTKEQILAQKDCSFNGKEYVANRDIVPGDGFKMIPLGELCEYVLLKKENEDVSGKFNYYTCSQTIKKCKDGLNNGKHLIIATRGSCLTSAIFYESGQFGIGDNLAVYKEKEVNMNYVYNMYKVIQPWVTNCLINKTVIPMITNTQIKNIKLPIPENPDVLKSWVTRLTEAYRNLRPR